MKSLSAAIVVTAGGAIIMSSQLCEALIRRSFGAWDSSIVIYGLALGTTMIAVGVLGWGYTVWSRTDSPGNSDSKAG
jgi:hypothetical protein